MLAWFPNDGDRNPGPLSIGELDIWVCADAMRTCYIFLLPSMVDQISRTDYRDAVSVCISFPANQDRFRKGSASMRPRSSAGQVSGLLPYPKPRVIRASCFYLRRCLVLHGSKQNNRRSKAHEDRNGLRQVNIYMQILRNVRLSAY